MPQENKLKVLACAFACFRNPDVRFGSGKDGEGVLGWNIVLQLSRFFDVSVLTHLENKEAIEEKLLNEKLSGINFYYINLPPLFNFTKKLYHIYYYLWQMKAYFVAKRLNEKNHFNVFHHITYGNDWMASYIGALLPVPYIRGPGAGGHHVPKTFLKDYPFADKFSQKIRAIGQWVFRHDPFFIIGQNRASAILICNRESFAALSEERRKKAYLFSCNGVSKEDLFLLSPNVKNINDEFSILTAGKLIKIKGFDLAIKAFKIFSDKIPTTKLTIVGDGPELKNLEELAGELNLGQKIIFERWLPREKLLQKMLSCDVFLFASVREGGGAVVVEAMAAGKPVICFDLAGPGLHVNENCGIKIRTENSEQALKDMAAALEKLYFDRNLLAKLASGARERAEKDYDWDKLGDRLFDIYKKALNYDKQYK